MEKKDGKEKVQIRIKPGSDRRTRIAAAQLDEIFNGPLFARMVREAVEEMILEGKLTYDMDNDSIDIPEDIVKKWCAEMERKGWKRKKKPSSKAEK